MKSSCGCCRGVEALTPVAERNRPGLDHLEYRVGTYATFFESMKARLSGSAAPARGALRTRDSDDPAIAFLDAWAVIGDVLSFYQERIANEGYLRTAMERRSILELARLVGYELRPGVSATVFLAYTLDPNSEATIAVGTRAQSVPGPGELPQSFETADPLDARASWNDLGPRLVQPQIITPAKPELYVAGTNANLKANDFLLLEGESKQAPKKVVSAEADFANSRTKIKMQDTLSAAITLPANQSPLDTLVGSIAPLTKPPAEHPRNALQLPRSRSQVFAPQTDSVPALLTAFHPEIDRHIYQALKAAAVTPDPAIRVHAFRVQASPFGYNAPPKPILDNQGRTLGTEEWPLSGSTTIAMTLSIHGIFSQPGGLGEFSIGRLDRAMATTAAPVFIMVISIKQGSESASNQFQLTKDVHKVDVGKWRVNISTPDPSSSAMQFDFLAPLNRRVVLGGQGTLEVTIDSRPPVECPLGQTVSSSEGGHRLSISASERVAAATTGIAASTVELTVSVVDETALPAPDPKMLLLDSVYDQILPQSWVLVDRPGNPIKITRVVAVQKVTASDYGISAKVTRLQLQDPWLDPATDLTLAVARETTIYAQSEQLVLADEPISDNVSGSRIELDDLYAGLQPGRWLIVEGERTDIAGVAGAELVMLSALEQDVQKVSTPPPVPASTTQDRLDATPQTEDTSVAIDNSNASVAPVVRPGDKTHSFLVLAKPLAYSYKRDTVSIFGNVVRATHGETRSEILGSGDAGQELQALPLHQWPLTYVAAPTPAGAASTLQVRVNDLLWHEVDSLAELAPSDRNYVTRTDDAAKTTVVFGNGTHGARLPSGMANVSATYRTGIGSPGNVAAQQISLLATRPLGIRAVINPLLATGGADRDTRDQARRNAPLGVTALDRLVSVPDYADFTRTFAGIGKADAAMLSDGHRRLVYLTIAGNGDIPIGKESDLYQNLVRALQDLGDPHQPFQVESREVLFLVVAAKVQVLPDYKWESVQPAIKATMLDVFGFERRNLGEDVRLSQIISAIQQVAGVQYVDVDMLDVIGQTDIQPAKDDKEPGSRLKTKLAELAGNRAPRNRIPVQLARFDTKSRQLRPSQLAYLNPEVPDTLILTEISQ
jgi:predicted phage baseplate assembly protein